TARFAEDHIFVLGVTNLTDRRETVLIHTANFAGRQTQLRIAFVARHQRRTTTSGTDHLTATARSHFDVVNRQTDGNILERKCISDLGFCSRTALQGRTNRETNRSQNITAFAILVFKESKTRAPNRIVLDRDNLRLNTVLVALEIDQTNL